MSRFVAIEHALKLHSAFRIYRLLENMFLVIFMISWILTAYNQEEILPKTVEFLIRELKVMKIEFIISDDGSSDGTLEVAKKCAQVHKNVRFITSDHRGRGSALKNGINAARGDIVVFSSADVIINRKYFESVISKMGENDVVLLSKGLPGASPKNRKLTRIFLSYSYKILVRFMYKTKFRDMQGIKIFRAEKLKKIMSYCRDDGFFFDTEIVLVAYKKRLKIIEVPWSSIDYRKSSVRLSTVFYMLRQLILFYPRFRKIA